MAIGRTVEYYARAVQALSAEIKCRQCTCDIPHNPHARIRTPNPEQLRDIESNAVGRKANRN